MGRAFQHVGLWCQVDWRLSRCQKPEGPVSSYAAATGDENGDCTGVPGLDGHVGPGCSRKNGCRSTQSRSGMAGDQRLSKKMAPAAVCLPGALADDLVGGLEPPGPAGAGISCGKCAQLNRVGCSFCRGCGAPLDATAVEPTATDRAGSCPRCGHINPVNSAFCAECGVALQQRPSPPAPRVEAPTLVMASEAGSAPPFDHGAPDAPEPVRHRAPRWATLLATAAVLLLAAGSGSAIVLATHTPNARRGHTPNARRDLTARTSTSQTSSTGEAGATISEQQVRSILSAYAAAYSAESPRDLLRLFAPTLVRRNRSLPAQNLRAALVEYRKQFSELQHAVYRLSNVAVAINSNEASASADFTITSQSGTINSPIAFHLVRDGSQLLIDQITIPSTP